MKFLWVLLFFSFISFASAQYDVNNALIQVKERGEVFVSIDLKEFNGLKNSISDLSYDKTNEGRIYFYSNLKGISQLSSNNINFRLEAVPSMLIDVKMANSVSDFTSNWDAYPTYQQYDSLMHQFAFDYPNICKLHTLGTLSSGRKIYAVQLGDSVNVNQNELRFLYTSTMHGDEVTGYVMMLRLIDYLLSNYTTNAEVQFLMNNIDIWINPLANPDGTYYSGNNSVYGATRYNANSIDINRNFPDPEDGMHPDGNLYQPETQMFMALADSVHFTMAANFHGGSEVVNYPWDTWSRLAADNLWWIHTSKRFADSAQFYSPSNYMTKFGTGYTNGYQWYSISGGRQDYMNFFQHCREATIELSNTKTVAENQLPNYWSYLRRSFLYYLHDATYGFNGQTTDSITHFAVKSKLTILNFDKDSSEIYSNDSGFYFRPIAAGTYDLQFSANGYHSKILYGVQMAQDSVVKLNVELSPKSISVDIDIHTIGLNLFPNPLIHTLNIESSVLITDVSVFSIHGAKLLQINDVNSLFTKLDLSKYHSGVYFIRINTLESNLLKKIIIE